nr:Rz1-like lysis system protein LysC [Pelistega sp. MC2]
MILSACSTVNPIYQINQCPVITTCQLRGYTIERNEDLVDALLQVEEDWSFCAAKVDVIVQCQERTRAKTQ